MSFIFLTEQTKLPNKSDQQCESNSLSLIRKKNLLIKATIFWKQAVISGDLSPTHLRLVPRSHRLPPGLVAAAVHSWSRRPRCASQTARVKSFHDKGSDRRPSALPSHRCRASGCRCCPSMARGRKVLAWKRSGGEAQCVCVTSSPPPNCFCSLQINNPLGCSDHRVWRGETLRLPPISTSCVCLRLV